MNIEHLRSFVTLADTLNFRKASEMLYLSQPALSRQISELERNIGATLLKRTTRLVSLTPAGKACLENAKRILREWDAMRHSAERAYDKISGTLRVGTYGANSTYYLSYAFEQFKASYPGVQLTVTGDTVERLRDKLQNGEIDLLSIMLPCLSGIPDIEYLILAEENPSVMLPLSHPLANRERIDLKELSNERIMLHSPKKSQQMFNKMMELCLNAGFTPNIIDLEDNDNLIPLRIVMGEAIGLYPSDRRIMMPPIPYESPPGTVLIPLNCDTAPFSRVIAWRCDNKNTCRSLLLDFIRT